MADASVINEFLNVNWKVRCIPSSKSQRYDTLVRRSRDEYLQWDEPLDNPLCKCTRVIGNEVLCI